MICLVSMLILSIISLTCSLSSSALGFGSSGAFPDFCVAFGA